MGNAVSRAHAVAPFAGAEASFRGPSQGLRPPAPRAVGRALRPTTSRYLDRAMLLWPRLDRAKVRKVADNPERIAEIVERRTSQPYDVILAMLTRQPLPPTAPTDDLPAFASGRVETTRFALRIVRSDEGNAIEVQDLLPL
jgi:hypothetical protein